MQQILASLIRFSPLPWLVREFVSRKRVTIVLYHSPEPNHLRDHLAYYKKHYNFTTLSNLVTAIRTQDASLIPRRGLVVTFDDGHRTNYDLLPLFQEFNVKPTIYLCSAIVGTNRRFWFQNCKTRESLKRMKNEDRLNTLEREYGFRQTEESDAERQSLSYDEVREMKPFVEFASHTRFHPVLTMCEDAECLDEIARSRTELEALLDSPCPHFSYPNGDYTIRESGFVRDAGYLSGRSISVGWNDLNVDPYELRITGVSDNATRNVLIAQLTGLPMYLKYLKRGNAAGRYTPISPGS